MLSTLRFLYSLNQIDRLTGADPAIVQRLQQQRLRELIAFAAARSPLYRDKYQGIDLKHCSLAELPTLTKSEAMCHFEYWVADRQIKFKDAERFIASGENAGKLFQDKYVLLHTSGSQGQPTIVVQTPRNVQLTFMFQATRGNTTGRTDTREIVSRFMSPARLAVVTLKRGFYPTAANFDFFPAELRPFVKLKRWSQTDPDLVSGLNAYSPTVISGYANVLLSLADEVRAGELRFPHLKHLLNYSEQLNDAARDHLMETFGVPVLNMYATGECGHLTSGCPTHRGAHVNCDWAILEVVDSQGRPVPAGTCGAKVYVTNLANHVQPLIRYEVTDMVTMATEPCSCGSKLPRVDRIEGRRTDCLWVIKDERWARMDAFVFKHALEYSGEVMDWQVRQEEPHRIRLSVAVLPGRTLNEERLHRNLREQLQMYGFGDVVRVDVEAVQHIAADQHTAKVRRVICRTGPDRHFATDDGQRIAAA